MKKTHSLLLVLFFCLACNNDFDESAQIETSVVSNTTNTTNNTTASLASIVGQLVSTYRTTNTGTSMTLGQTITLLDSISNLNNHFLELKPLAYTPITTLNAQKFITNYNEEYQLLNGTLPVKAYYAQMLGSNVNWNVLEQAIATDTQLNATEKASLIFIVQILKGDPPYGDDGDDYWKKKGIVAAHLGFNESDAQAVFNVALAAILQQ